MTFENDAVRIIISSSLPLLLTLAGLGYFVVTDKFILKLHKRILMIALVVVTLIIASNILDYFLTNHYFDPTLRSINCVYAYIVYPLLIVLFHYFVDAGSKYLPAWILIGVNTVIYLTTLFAPLAFSIDENNIFVRGPFGFTCHIICGMLLLDFLCLTYRKYKRRPKYVVIPLFCFLMLVGSMILDTVMPGSDKLVVSYVMIAIVISCVLFYIWIHLQFEEEYEEKLLAQQHVRIMMSQIQPHFLYNTIATFKALCRSDPEKAATVAEKFGQYLRENLDSLSSKDLIPVEYELEHTRVYADIEMVRFENIRVEYDIQDTYFTLPPLTIQPMVENAIRHGVRSREEGVVRVTTRLTDECHEVVISDNGIGFDTSNIESGDGTHIGIKNVSERIEKMCGGTVTIMSEPGIRTAVTFRIPLTEMKK